MSVCSSKADYVPHINETIHRKNNKLTGLYAIIRIHIFLQSFNNKKWNEFFVLSSISVISLTHITMHCESQAATPAEELDIWEYILLGPEFIQFIF